MANITKRSTKGSPLTHAEMDSNFENLNIELEGKEEEGVAQELVDTIIDPTTNKIRDTVTKEIEFPQMINTGTDTAPILEILLKTINGSPIVVARDENDVPTGEQNIVVAGEISDEDLEAKINTHLTSLPGHGPGTVLGPDLTWISIEQATSPSIVVSGDDVGNKAYINFDPNHPDPNDYEYSVTPSN